VTLEIKILQKLTEIIIADGPLAGVIARAIFVVDKDGNIVYKQLVPEITDEPNYEEALNAAKETASK